MNQTQNVSENLLAPVVLALGQQATTPLLGPLGAQVRAACAPGS
jgi:hypothetical protein